ncbi:Invasin [compost metagenome]
MEKGIPSPPSRLLRVHGFDWLTVGLDVSVMKNNPISFLGGHLSPLMKILSWLNICLQIALPISAAFTPVIAAQVNKTTFLPAGGEVATMATRPYTLAPGETVDMVAAHYNMTPDALRKLNQFRSFAHGWTQLRPGDELDVPLAPLPKVVWEGGAKSASASGDAQALRAAGLASRVGGFWASNPNGEAASSLARGMATSAVGGEIQQWLNQFGTARVQLDADKHFSLNNSQLDLLVPLHEQKDKLVFTQGSVHRTDERTQVNLGLGYRWFADDWMLGGNTFLDHDISRSHTRMGVGMEYWRDFLKLSANGYMRLSGWKDSPDLTDYEERPANGWDVRAQAWLPAMPQLGGKLTYEQYYGNEVGLFGKDNRQRDPHAITAGVNYTPVPLLTFNAEYRQGQSGQNDARLGVEMRYQLGGPWRQQLDPGAVSALRSLAGSRHDLVERNNNIVLEYRKKEVIRLHTTETVTGHAGEKKSLGVLINSKYGLARIDWAAPALLAAGGKIVHDGAERYSVVLPAYQTAPGAVNTYTVSGVAIDTHDNTSNRTETEVTVLAPIIDAANSQFSAAPNNIPADNNTTITLTLVAKDIQGNALSALQNNLVFVVRDAQGKLVNKDIMTQSTITESEQKGTYITTLKGTLPGTYTIFPEYNGTTVGALSCKVTFISTAPSVLHSTLTADKPQYTLGDTVTLTATLKTANDQLMDGQEEVLNQATMVLPGTSAVTLSWTRNGHGTYTASYVPNAVVSPATAATLKLAGWSTPVQSPAYGVQMGEASPQKSTLTADKLLYTVGDTVTLTATLKTANDQLMDGQEEVLNQATMVLPGTSAVTLSWTRNGHGTYTASYVPNAVVSPATAATLKLAGWSTPVQSPAYGVQMGGVVKIVTTAGKEYSPEQHFPKTGFNGASFKIMMSSDNKIFNFRISDGAGIASVSNDGVVTILGHSTGHVSVLISSKGSEMPNVKYDFTIESAYHIDSSVSVNSESYVLSRCSGLGGSLVSLTNNSDWPGGKFILSNDWGRLFLYKNGWEVKSIYAIESPEIVNESGNVYFLNTETNQTGELLEPTAGLLCKFK